MTIGYLLCLALALVAQGASKSTSSDVPDYPAFKEPGAKIVKIGSNLWLDGNEKARRVLVRASVCQQNVTLEEFLCLARTKEHESILAADINAEVFHAALIAAGAKPGGVARYDPDSQQFHPPHGDRLEIAVEWKQRDQTKRAKAQEWIRNVSTNKSITYEFVFAGSQEMENPVTKKMYYLGNDGDIISVANFASSVIDLAVQSSNANEQHLFEAYQERIPPIDTEVIVILKPAPKQEQEAPKGSRKSEIRGQG
jgi:hypothetical protein